MSQIQGRVFDSSIYGWVADVASSLSASGYATITYVDSSLSARDTSIDFLKAYNAIQDASIAALASDDVTQAYVDGSLGARDTSIAWLKSYDTIQDTSIGLKADKTYVDGSLSLKADKTYVDSSLSSMDASIAYIASNYVEEVINDPGIGASWSLINSSEGPSVTIKGFQTIFPLQTSNTGPYLSTQVSTTWINNLDSSINGAYAASASYDTIQDVSIANALTKNTAQDVSIAFLNTYRGVQDTSISTLESRVSANDVSIAFLNTYRVVQDTSISTLQTGVSANDTSIAWLDSYREVQDTSIAEKLPFQIARDTYFTTGFVNRTDSSLAFDSSTRVFTISTGSSYSIYNESIKSTISADASTQLSDDVGIHYIWYDSSASLQHAITAWSIVSNNAPVATVYWDGSKGTLNEERHSAGRNLEWHEWAHDTIGTRYESGLAGTFQDGSTSFTAGYIHDEDIDFYISTQTLLRPWYRKTGGLEMTFDSSTLPYAAKVIGGVLQYDNAGTLTNVTNNYYICNWVYAETNMEYPIFFVVGQAQYNKLSDALLDPAPTIPNIISPEYKLLYRTVWQNNSGTPDYIQNQDLRLQTSLPGAGTSTVSAASVTFSPYETIEATNVQAAIQEVVNEFTTKTYVDSSLGARDASIAWLNAYRIIQDASIASIAGVDKTYVDSSLGFRDVSIAFLNTYRGVQDTSIALKANLNTAFTEVSTAYVVLSTDNNKIIKCDASLVVTFPDSLTTGFQCTVLNASTGYVRLDASTLRTTDSSTQLKNLYAGASAVHYGSGIWYAWGNLKG